MVRATERFFRDVNSFGDPGEAIIHRFSGAADLGNWVAWSDSTLGGKSTAGLSVSPHTEGAALFSGVCSSDLPDDVGSRLRRSGFAGISTKITGDYTDLDGFQRLVYRVNGDGRIYIANLRTDNWLLGQASDDVWQAALPTRSDSGWEEIEIPLHKFVLTHKGRVLPEANQIHPGRVVSMGIALADSKELNQSGPFKLELEWIKGKSASVT